MRSTRDLPVGRTSSRGVAGPGWTGALAILVVIAAIAGMALGVFGILALSGGDEVTGDGEVIGDDTLETGDDEADGAIDGDDTTDDGEAPAVDDESVDRDSIDRDSIGLSLPDGEQSLADARTTIHGSTANDTLGERVVGIGDLSGNGTEDVALGVPNASLGDEHTDDTDVDDTDVEDTGVGAVYLFFGPVAEGDLDASEANLTITGESADEETADDDDEETNGERFGHDVDAADLTGDGMIDLVVGAPDATHEDGDEATGAVYVFTGADLAALVDDGQTDLTLDDASATIRGNSAGDRFGFAVTAHGESVGEETTDERDDGYSGSGGEDDRDDEDDSDAENGHAGFLAAGATGVGEGAGAVYVFDDIGAESTENTTDRVAGDAATVFTGESASDLAGWSLAVVEDGHGDVDSDSDDSVETDLDGSPTLAIGAPGGDDADDPGAVYVVDDPIGVEPADGDDQADGDGTGDDGDVSQDGDATDDDSEDEIVERSLADADLTLQGENAGDRAGLAIATVVGVGGDDRGGLIVGAPYHDDGTGVAYVLSGDTLQDGMADEESEDADSMDDDAGENDAVTASLADADLRLIGEEHGDLAGWAVAGTTATDESADDEQRGDEHGDDAVDAVLVGAPGGDTGGENAGVAYVVDVETDRSVESDESAESDGSTEANGSIELELADAESTLVGEAPGDEAGTAVAVAGDVTGNAATDVLVGAPGHDSTAAEEKRHDGDDRDKNNGVAYVVEGEKPDDPVKVDETVAIKDVIKEEKLDEVDVDEEKRIEKEKVVKIEQIEKKERIDVEKIVSVEEIEKILEKEIVDVKEVVKVETIEKIVKEKIVLEEDAHFDVEILKKNDPVVAGEELIVSVAVTNTGDRAGTQDITLAIGDREVDVAAGVSLEPAETETVTLTWPTEADDVGEHTVTVTSDDDAASQAVTVKEDRVGEPFFDVEIVEKNDPIEAGETLAVTAEITNTGDTTDTQDVRLEVGGIEEDVAAGVELGPGERQAVELRWQSDEGDAGQHTVKVRSNDTYDYQKIDVETPDPEVPEPDEPEPEEPDPEEPVFEITDVSKNDPIEVGESLTVGATVSNIGDGEGAQDVTLTIVDADGDEIHDASQELTLDAGTSETIDFEWDSEDAEAGTYTAIVRTDDDAVEQAFELRDAPEPDVAEMVIDELTKNDPIDVSDTLTVDANVTNVGDASGTQSVTISITDENDEEVFTDSVEITLDPTETTPVEFAWDSEDAEAGTYTVTVVSDDDTVEQAFEVEEAPVEEPEEAFFEIQEVTKNDPLEANETLTANVTVANTGDAEGTQNVTLQVDGVGEIDSEERSLEPTENETLTLEWNTTDVEPGEYPVTIETDDDAETQTVTIEEPEPAEPFFEVTDVTKNDPIEESETLTVDADISNTGDGAGVQDVFLSITDDDDTEVFTDAEAIDLDPTESGPVTFDWDSEDAGAGNYTATVSTDDDSVEQAFEIVEVPDEEAFFEIQEVTKNDPIEANETLTANVTVANVGETDDTQNVTMAVDEVGEVDSQELALEPTENETITLEWNTTDVDPDAYTVSIETNDTAISQAVTIEEPEAPYFEITGVEKNDPINVSETLTVDANVTNVGETAGTQNVSLAIAAEDAEVEDGEVFNDSQETSLEPDENETVTFEWDSEDAEAGNFTANVSTDDESVEQELEVFDGPFFEIQEVTTNDPLEVNETMTANVTVENTGDVADTQNVTLEVDGIGEVDGEELSLDPTANETPTLEWNTTDVEPGEYTVTVETNDTSVSQAVTLEEPPPDEGDDDTDDATDDDFEVAADDATDENGDDTAETDSDEIGDDGVDDGTGGNGDDAADDGTGENGDDAADDATDENGDDGGDDDVAMDDGFGDDSADDGFGDDFDDGDTEDDTDDGDDVSAVTLVA